jgi:integrase
MGECLLQSGSTVERYGTESVLTRRSRHCLEMIPIIHGTTGGDMMVKIRLRYVAEDTDRHGNPRLYFRRKGQPKVRLPGLPGSDEFMAVYRAALAGIAKASHSRASPGQRPTHGSLRWLCESYFSSADFKRLDNRTQRVRRNILDGLCARHGEKPAAKMEVRHVRALRDERLDRPEAANAIVKALRQVFSYAIDADLVSHNPARDVAYLRSGSQGFHSWTIEEIRQFEERHPIGTKARLAMALLLYTGQRRSDVILFGRQHVRSGRLIFTQQKNRNYNPISLSIPIIPVLQAIIEGSPCGDLTFLVTEFRRPFTAAGFGNKFRDWCNQAGLPNCSAHGLRKAAAARLAELGATESEIMAITGHRTSKEVTRYTRAARQAVLADSAMARLSKVEIENKSVPLEVPMRKSGTKSKSK